jgi:hypothetical protein
VFDQNAHVKFQNVAARAGLKQEVFPGKKKEAGGAKFFSGSTTDSD